MIFVTVGTTSFPFPRLIKMVRSAITQLRAPEKLVIQTKNKEIPFPTMIKLMKKARIIICHGGPATIFLALQYGKNKPFVIPRRTEFGEHTDNHQVYFASWMMTKNLVTGSIQKDCFKELKKYLLNPTPATKRTLQPSTKLTKKLSAYTNTV